MRKGEFMLLKRIFALTFLIFAAFLVGQDSVSAQIKKSNSLYDAPARLMFPGDEKEQAEMESADLLRAHFYPIGWSKDGKLAYYVEPPDEACDCYFADLVVQDLRTDKVLWQRRYDSGNEPENAPRVTLATYWKKNQKEFSRRLAQYGIVAQNKFALTNAPFEYQTDLLTPKVDVNLTVEEDTVAGDVILRLLSKNKGSKTIYREIYKKGYDSIRGAEIAGVLLSPFDARAAVIMVETHRGWEGPPNVTHINIVGASLINGFR